jgi:predicted GIY-YIG superfamily endonuclease
LKSHLAGISGYTSVAKDWKMVYTEIFETRIEAIKRENQIKKKKSRKYIEWLILLAQPGQKDNGDGIKIERQLLAIKLGARRSGFDFYYRGKRLDRHI